MREVMFDVMLLKPQTFRVHIESLCQQSANVVHGGLALPHFNEVQNLGRIRQRILNLLGEICVAVLAYGDVLNIGDLCAYDIETRLSGQSRKSSVMLKPV
jgi:hypothetical protein